MSAAHLSTYYSVRMSEHSARATGWMRAWQGVLSGKQAAPPCSTLASLTHNPALTSPLDLFPSVRVIYLYYYAPCVSQQGQWWQPLG